MKDECFVLSSQRPSTDTKSDAELLAVGAYETASAMKGSTGTTYTADVMFKVDGRHTAIYSDEYWCAETRGDG